MSRESKIGLLVATAFILVVGLLLSDHVTVATRQPPAPFGESAKGIDSGLRVPGVTPQPVVLPEPEVQPEPEPAKSFVYESPAPVAPGHIDVRIGHAPQPQPVQLAQGPALDPVWDNPPVPTSMEQVALEHEQPLIAVNPAQLTAVVEQPTPPAPKPVDKPADQPIGIREYVAKPGDTLGHLAAKAFGRSTESNNAKVVALNPSLADNPNLIVAGRTYRLPSDAAQAAVVQEPRPKAEAKTYTVKPNDNLWQIAARALGDGNRHKEIVALNPSLNDPSTLQVGMKLRLPS